MLKTFLAELILPLLDRIRWFFLDKDEELDRCIEIVFSEQQQCPHLHTIDCDNGNTTETVCIDCNTTLTVFEW